MRVLSVFTLFIVLFFGLSSIPAAQAQATGSLSGTVVRADTEAPLPGANVVLLNTNRGTATDNEGAFSIQDIEPGTYTVRASAVGYEAAEQAITIEAGAPTTVQLALRPARVALAQVDVTATPLE